MYCIYVKDCLKLFRIINKQNKDSYIRGVYILARESKINVISNLYDMIKSDMCYREK